MATPPRTITVDANAALGAIVALVVALLPNDAASMADSFEHVAKRLREQASAAAKAKKQAKRKGRG